MSARSPEDRVLIARLAAATRWAKTDDRSAATASARRALKDRFEREVDPDGTLSPDERARRAGYLQKAHMLRMSRAAAQARANIRAATKLAEYAEAELETLGDAA